MRCSISSNPCLSLKCIGIETNNKRPHEIVQVVKELEWEQHLKSILPPQQFQGQHNGLYFPAQPFQFTIFAQPPPVQDLQSHPTASANQDVERDLSDQDGMNSPSSGSAGGDAVTAGERGKGKDGRGIRTGFSLLPSTASANQEPIQNLSDHVGMSSPLDGSASGDAVTAGEGVSLLPWDEPWLQDLMEEMAAATDNHSTGDSGFEVMTLHGRDSGREAARQRIIEVFK